MIAGLTKGDKAVRAEKTSDQPRELSVAAVVLKVNRKIDVAVNKYLKFVWAYLFTAMLLLYRSSFRAILLSKQSTFSY